MRLAREGLPQMLGCSVILGPATIAAVIWFWPAAIVTGALWVWTIAFFRDPVRLAMFAPEELCSPADGRVVEVARLDRYDPIEGPVLRIAIFLSLFNVHINRSPCEGRVRSTEYRKGKFLAAMKPGASVHNESNTVVIDADPPIPGPCVVRQIAGVAARRIICHTGVGDRLSIGERFGLIKFGSRTELIVPYTEKLESLVEVGDRVCAGLTPVLRYARPAPIEDTHASDSRGRVDLAGATA